MKLRILYEEVLPDISGLIKKAKDLGFDIKDPILQKIFDFIGSGQYNHDRRGYANKELKQLLNNERLLALLSDFDTRKQIHNQSLDEMGLMKEKISIQSDCDDNLIFKPENLDVARWVIELNKKHPMTYTNQRTHLIFGMVFGYSPEGILRFVNARSQLQNFLPQR